MTFKRILIGRLVKYKNISRRTNNLKKGQIWPENDSIKGMQKIKKNY